MTERPTLVWLRCDLRLADNPALVFAAARGPVVPLYIDDTQGTVPTPGAASRVWLHHALAHLIEALGLAGSGLIIRRGDALSELLKAAKECNAEAIVWNRRYTPDDVALDTRIKTGCKDAGLAVRSFAGTLLNEPHEIRNKQGTPFKVFTAFYKHCLATTQRRAPDAAPERLASPAVWPAGTSAEALALLPGHGWAESMMKPWEPSEHAGHRALEKFASAAVVHYDTGRDQPGTDGVSRLSPYLHFGQLSTAQVAAAVAPLGDAAGPYVRQLYWRDFAHHLLFHFPAMPSEELTPAFRAFPWLREDDVPGAVAAWRQGMTGYPLIDAGMRELWQTGWMHNRIRMNVASFLVKHLRVDWRVGLAWFWDTLVDADLANNSMGWQWGAGCGVDAAPYFRIFNPVAQGQRFDKDGTYVRRFVPELKRLPDRWLHEPWAADAATLRAAGVSLGTTYPHPVVDHKTARAEALAAFAHMRRS